MLALVENSIASITYTLYTGIFEANVHDFSKMSLHIFPKLLQAWKLLFSNVMISRLFMTVLIGTTHCVQFKGFALSL